MEPQFLTEQGEGSPLIACILVTWNGWKQTERCLHALGAQKYPSLAVILVDNGSTDGTVERTRREHPSVVCIENGENLGFAKACNVGARRGLEEGAKLLWFLNNDTEAPPDTAGKLVAKMRSDPRFGVVGAVLYFLGDRSKVQAWGGGVISLWTGFNRHFTGPWAFGRRSDLTFASVLVRKETFEDLGGLWEGAFMYFEDADFSLRAVKAGWRLGVAEDTAILHAENGSHAGNGRRNPRLDRINTRSGLLLLSRHGAVPAVSMLIFVLLRMGKRMALRDWGSLAAVVDGVRDWRRGEMAAFRESA